MNTSVGTVQGKRGLEDRGGGGIGNVGMLWMARRGDVERDRGGGGGGEEGTQRYERMLVDERKTRAKEEDNRETDWAGRRKKGDFGE